MRYEGKYYDVWSSLTGNSFTGIVRSHLVPRGTDKTLCGRKKGRMTTVYNSFSRRNDCQVCAKKAEGSGE